jgi:MinD superfamily P-loop ATPase
MMKQILILSGKGGTGKTTVAAALTKLLNVKACADCDVDAPNLHLILEQSAKPEVSAYYGMPKASIDSSKCIKCGLCLNYCRFEALRYEDNCYSIDPFACEGCGVCQAVCPAEAVSLNAEAAGKLMLYRNDGSVFSTARLNMGSGATGKLVTEVKKQLRAAVTKDTALAVIDGSPGIGCPVISSLSGVSLVLIVAEPSVSGISDMKRIIKAAQSFHIKIAVCVNKYDVNLKNSDEIESFCRANKLFFAGRLPYDSSAVSATNRGLTIADIDCPSGTAVRSVCSRVMAYLNDITQ